MTRVGWVCLAFVLAGLAALLATTRFGGPGPTPASVGRAVDRVEDAVGAKVRRWRGGGDLLVVPVLGVARTAIVDTWGQTRGEGREHHGTDIPAPGGTAVVAAADGTVEKLFPSRLGGTTLYERSLDRRWTYYYAHLAGYAPGVHEGQLVRAGDTIGYVGDTGDAGPGNFHLHFGLASTAPDQRWYQGKDVNAFPLLAGRTTAR